MSVIVTTFQWPQALAVVLDGLARQVDRAFEVVVADDGSGPETAAVVDRFGPEFAGRFLHVRQPHRGFRAAAIRNAAIRAASGDYLVFLDGDSIPGPRFISEHRSAARPGRAMRGRRTLLSPGLTARCLDGSVRPWEVGVRQWLRWKLSGDVSRLRPLLSFDLAPPITRTGIAWRRIHTVNFAAWRSDLVAVNGFDESFVGWGLEDSDLVVRLGVAGVRTRGLGPAASVFHLHHPPAAPAAEVVAERSRRIERNRREGTVRCPLGLDRLDAEATVRAVAGLEKPARRTTVPPHVAA